jgi:thymidylate kinase
MALEQVPYSDIQNIVSVILPYIQMPDKVILFTVDRKEQLKRHQNKHDDVFQNQLIQNDEFQVRVTNNYRTVLNVFDINWEEINTTNLSLDETKEIVHAKLKILF